MKYPSFFDEVDKIKLYEPLGKFLGAFETGEVEISYLNCVVLAGHSARRCRSIHATFNGLRN